ncbi:MAG: PD40 domain-containing protein [Fibrobacteria bacterium]|nr:PD40 domain-containing protein [Fibrobacteria bacterium]
MKFLFGVSFLFMMWSSLWATDVYIETLHPNEARLPLGYIEFRPVDGETRKLPLDFGKVIADDLNFSGRVKIIEALRADSLTMNYFMHNEAYAYISGDYAYQGANVVIRCFLKDVETNEQILGKKYIAQRNQLRQVAHRFSDELIYQLFGEKGIAQTQIVFVSKQSGTKAIYTMDYDGANYQKASANTSLNLLPCWMRDNKAIMYTSYKLGRPQLFFKALPNGIETVFQISKFMNTGATYNPVDGEVAYTSSVKGNTEIFRVSEAGGKPVRLTYSKAMETSPSWSPNGYEIVFTSSRAGPPMLYIMDRDGSNVRRLTYEGNYNTSPAWSPKGDKIAFCSMGAGGKMNIFTISPTGANLRKLTFDSGSNEHPSWSPDGRAIVFCSNRLGRKEIYQMQEDGSGQRQVTFFGQNMAPDWSFY